MNSQHILIVNRFDSELGQYHRYIDPGHHRVAYITTAAGRRPLDEQTAEAISEVADLTDWADVLEHAVRLADKYGSFDHLLALSEFDLDLGAHLREKLGIAGPRPDDVRRVRDKVVMKTLISQAGLRVPRFAVVDSADTVRDFAAVNEFPLVLKPRAGWDSQGVLLVKSQSALDDVLRSQSLTDYECEEFVSGQMLHLDGVAKDGVVKVFRSSRLLTSCLDFALGTPFGSIANDDAVLESKLRGYAQRVVTALDMGTSAFHLEVFLRSDSINRPTPAAGHDDIVFLEIGGRVGGAQIPYIWREVYGVDLVETWVRMLLGESPRLPDVGPRTQVGGYLLMPEPPVRPCRVKHVRAQLDTVPAMYAELLPSPGAVLDGTGGCKETAGRYRYRAETSAAIESAIAETVRGYDIVWEPLDKQTGDSPTAQPKQAGRSQAAVWS